MSLDNAITFFKELDTQLFLAINGTYSHFFDVCMHYISSKLFWIPFYVFLLVLILKKYKQQTWLILAFVVLIIAMSDQACLHLFKNVFMRYRPCHNLLLASKIHLVDGCGGQYGFVSSHAANTFALAYFVISLLKDNYKYISLLYIWAALVAYSRIYLGQHYPADCVVGALLGLSISFIVTKFYTYSKTKIYAV